MRLQNFGLICLMAVGIGLSVTDVRAADTVLVCRARQCAAASYSMTRGFLFNKIAQMMEDNIGKTALLCEADPVSHVCLSEGIQAEANAAFARTQITIPTVKIVDSKLLKGSTGMDLVLDYAVRANNTTPRCQLALSRLNVDYVDKVEMTTGDFSCALTQTGNTSLNLSYNIDYLDFDYGFVGGWYTLGIGEAVRGDKTGYVLMRLTDKAPIAAIAPAPAVQVAPVPVVAVPVPAIEPEILKETAPAETQTVTTTKTTTPVRPRTIKTTVTETTTIIPGPNGGNAVLPAFRTIGLPDGAVVIEEAENGGDLTEAAVTFAPPAKPTMESRRGATEVVTDMIYLNELAQK